MDNIFDQQQIVKKLEELDALKAKVEHLLSLSEIGQDVRKELEEFKELRNKGVTIPHLEKQFADQIYPKRQAMGRYSKPITESEIKEAQERAEANQKRAKQEMSVAQAKAEEEAQKAQAEAEEKARLEAEASKPKKKSGGLGFILAGLGIVAAVVTFGATRDK